MKKRRFLRKQLTAKHLPPHLNAAHIAMLSMDAADLCNKVEIGRRAVRECIAKGQMKRGDWHCCTTTARFSKGIASLCNSCGHVKKQGTKHVDEPLFIMVAPIGFASTAKHAPRNHETWKPRVPSPLSRSTSFDNKQPNTLRSKSESGSRRDLVDVYYHSFEM